MKFLQKKDIQKGETLIEALAALALVAIVISAITTLITTSLSNATYNENQTLATKYAQQGIESVRQIRNFNYAAFRNYNGLYCLGKGQANLGTVQTACSTPNTDNFIRSVQIEHSPGCATNVARVTVNVAFTDGKCLSTVNPNGTL